MHFVSRDSHIMDGRRRLLLSGSILAGLFLLTFSLLTMAQDAPPAAPQTAPAGQAATATQNAPASGAPLRVMVGKSILINTSERLKRVAVTDPTIADPQVVTPTQVLVHGREPGEVSLLIWDELERSRSFDLRVDVDVTAASEEMNRIFPDERITVAPSRNAIVLSGHVSTEDVYKRAGDIATAYTKKVVNVLTFGPVGAQEVLLEVRFAEVDRTALLQWGANLFLPGQGHTVALSQTGQFGSVNVTTAQPTTTTQNGVTTTTTTASAPIVHITDFLNLFVARTDVNVGAVIRALQEKNLLQILAEPNLIAVNGKEASFLAGGEFPFPIVQPGGVSGQNAVTIQFKEFGVRLKFLPIITPSGMIHLHVAPEVSTLDFANALSVGGVTIPALSTRRAETEFELQDGQSFVIAGLMDNRVTNLTNKVPWLGDIPILGQFFRSKSIQKNNSELVVLVTARRISPSQEGKLPAYPEPFLDQKQFDNKSGKEKPPAKNN